MLWFQKSEISLHQILLQPFDDSSRRTLRTALNRWYARAGRSLPWRQTRDPYRIWISEVMLQQTTVKAVIPYYERFLQQFPTVLDLANASEEVVLQYWEGLGYYSRGRNLRRAAQLVRDQFNCQFPADLAQLQALPGIGRYTAGAIRSFGFDLPAPIVEANTLRLYCRLLGFHGDPRSQSGQELLWSFAELLQPRGPAGHLNQALMELGATVCTPTQPRCEECPLIRWCVAAQTGEQNTIPVKAARPQVTQLVEATAAIRCGEQWLIRQRDAQERWAGMWDFPRFATDCVGFEEKLTPEVEARLVRHVRGLLENQFGISAGELEEVMQIRHSVTRYRIRLLCLRGTVSARTSAALKKTQTTRWATLAELETLPMPVTGRKFAVRLKMNNDTE